MCKIFSCFTVKTVPGSDLAGTNFEICNIESFVNEFKQKVFKKLLVEIPLKSPELHLKFWKVLNEEKSALEKELSLSHKSSQIISDFLIRAKALECVLNYLNDRKSLEIVYDFQKNLVFQYCSGKITKNSIAKAYFNSVKGSYQIHGYIKINEMIQLKDIQKMLEFARNDYIQEMDKINRIFHFIDFKSLEVTETIDDNTLIQTKHKSQFSFGNEWFKY